MIGYRQHFQRWSGSKKNSPTTANVDGSSSKKSNTSSTDSPGLRSSIIARLRNHVISGKNKLAYRATLLTSCSGRRSLKRDVSSQEDIRRICQNGLLCNQDCDIKNLQSCRMTRDDSAVRYSFVQITSQTPPSLTPILASDTKISKPFQQTVTAIMATDKTGDAVFDNDESADMQKERNEELAVTIEQQSHVVSVQPESASLTPRKSLPLTQGSGVLSKIKRKMKATGRAVTYDSPEPGRSSYSKSPSIPSSPEAAAGAIAKLANNTAPAYLSNAVGYRLTIYLNEAHDLIAMDRCGTSDPYVRVKVDGKTAYKSKIVMRDLDPIWNETCVIELERLQQVVVLSLWDYDRGSVSDDFLGAVELNVSSLEPDRVINHRMVLKEKIGTNDTKISQRRYLGYISFSTVLKPISAAELMMKTELHTLLNPNQTWRQLVHVVVVGVSNVMSARELGNFEATAQASVYVRIAYASDNERTKSAPLSTGRSRKATIQETFNFYTRDDIVRDLMVEVYDADGNDLIGRATIPLSQLAIEQTHRFKHRLIEDTGTIELTATLTGSRQDVFTLTDPAQFIPTWTPFGKPILPPKLLEQSEAKQIECLENIFSFQKTANISGDYCGCLLLKVIQARNLTAADIIGKSDPFCVIEIVNTYLRTHTEYKTLEPRWNRLFMIPIEDISSVLTLTVFDEDRDRRADFLGKLAFPLLRLLNCQRRWFALKTNRLAPTASRGYIEIEARLFFNQAKAVLRATNPKELPYNSNETKISIKDLQRDVSRLRNFGSHLEVGANFIKDCIYWVSPLKTVLALLFWMIAVYYFELWMAPFAFICLFIFTYYMGRQGNLPSDESTNCSDDQLIDYDQNNEESKLSLKEKFNKVQELALSAQKAIDEAASTAERIKNVLLWRSPWISTVAVIFLIAASLVLYFVPLRWLVMAFGINKLTKKKLRPWALDNFEPYDLISRAPSDLEMLNYRDIPIDKRVLHDMHRQRKRAEQKAKSMQEAQADTMIISANTDTSAEIIQQDGSKKKEN